MTIIKVLRYPDPRLKKKGERVEKVDDTIRKIVDDMFETHYAQENCAALAACQLDFEHPKRITVIDYSEKKDQPFCLINPEIIDRRGEMYDAEGCMSVPGGTYEKVKRSSWIKVRALDREGKTMEFEAEGYFAKCIQHELDHLNGVLFIDRLSMLKRKRIDRKLAKLRKLDTAS